MEVFLEKYIHMICTEWQDFVIKNGNYNNGFIYFLLISCISCVIYMYKNRSFLPLIFSYFHILQWRKISGRNAMKGRCISPVLAMLILLHYTAFILIQHKLYINYVSHIFTRGSLHLLSFLTLINFQTYFDTFV